MTYSRRRSAVEGFTRACWSALFLALISALTSVISSLPARAGELRYIETSRPDVLNPIDASRNVIGMRALQLMYRGLVSQDEFGEWIPEMALALPEYLEETNELVFQLRDGLKWPDETPITPADVVHSFMIYRDERSRYGNANLFDVFESVVEDGARGVRFKLSDVSGNAMARSGFFVMPKHRVGEDTYIPPESEFNRQPMGAGPYAIVDLEDTRIEFESNPWYYKQRPSIEVVQLIVNPAEDVQMHLLNSGLVDLDPVVRPQDLPQLDANADIEVQPYNSQSWYGFAYNCRNGVLRFREVRQAFSIGFNRTESLKANFLDRGGLVSGPFTNASFCYNPAVESYPYDPKLTHDILDEVGLLDLDQDGWREYSNERIVLRMVLSKRMSESNKNVCADFQKQLNAHGIKVDVDYQDERVWYERVFVDGDYDITFVSWKFDDASNIYPLFSKSQQEPGLYNIAHFEHDEVEDYLTRFRLATDDAERTAIGQRLHLLLHQESPYTFLWTLEHSSAFRRDNIRSIRIQPFYFFTYIDEWKLEE